LPSNEKRNGLGPLVAEIVLAHTLLTLWREKGGERKSATGRGGGEGGRSLE